MRDKIAIAIEAVIFYALLTMIAVVAIPTARVGPWWDPIFESVVFVLAAGWLTSLMLRGQRFEAAHRMLLPLLGLAVFALVQASPLTGSVIGSSSGQTLTADPFETKRFALKLTSLTLVLGMLLSYTRNVTRLRALLVLIAGIGFVSAVVVVMRHLVFSESRGPEMSYAQFENRNHFAFLMEMSLGAVLSLVTSFGRQPAKRILISVLLASPIWTALVLTYSRGAVVSLVCQIVFFASLMFITFKKHGLDSRSVSRRIPRPRWVNAALVACLVLVSLASVVVIGGDELVRRIESVPAELNTSNNNPRTRVRRMEIWTATWHLVKENPEVGIGLGAYAIAIPRYSDSSGLWTPEQAHNEYLELLAGGGVVGATLGAVFIGLFAKLSLARLRSPDSFLRAAGCGALAGLFAVAIHSTFDFGLHITINALLAIGLIAVGTASVRNASDRVQVSSLKKA